MEPFTKQYRRAVLTKNLVSGWRALTRLMSVWRCSSIGVDLSTRHLFGLPGSDWRHAVVDTLLLSDGQDTAVVHGWRARVESFDVACFASWFASPSSKSNKPLLPDSLGLRCSFLHSAPRRPYLFAFGRSEGARLASSGWEHNRGSGLTYHRGNRGGFRKYRLLSTE